MIYISEQVEVEVEHGYSGCLMQLLVQPNLLEDYDKPAKEAVVVEQAPEVSDGFDTDVKYVQQARKAMQLLVQPILLEDYYKPDYYK